MNINFNVSQSSGSQSYRMQPVVAGDRSVDAAANAAGSAKRLDLPQTKVTFSSESLKLAEAAISVDKPESIKNYLSNFDFSNISPWDFSHVASKLFESGVIDKDTASSLQGVELAYEKPLDKYQKTNVVKIYEDTLNAAIEGGSTSGKDYHTRALDFVSRLADFAASSREKI